MLLLEQGDEEYIWPWGKMQHGIEEVHDERNGSDKC